MNTINNKITSIILVAATVTKPIGVSLPPLRSDLGTTKETLAPADAPVCCLQISIWIQIQAQMKVTYMQNNYNYKYEGKPLFDNSHLLQIPNGFSRINMVTLWTFPWQIIWIGQKRNTDPGIKELKLQQRICKKMQHSRFAPDKSSEVVLMGNWTESCTSESQPRNLDTIMIRKWWIIWWKWSWWYWC